MIKPKGQHHALIKIALRIRVGGSDRHVIVAHPFKQRGTRALGERIGLISCLLIGHVCATCDQAK